MIHYSKLIQIILNLTEIEALPKCIQNKSSEIRNLFSAEIPSLHSTNARKGSNQNHKSQTFQDLVRHPVGYILSTFNNTE